jgi:phage baseplate assembly protein W
LSDATTTSAKIREKFSQTAFRISQERSDFLLPQLLDFVRERKWINLRPEYQRRLVWDDAKRSLFIESLLLNVPVPAVFLFEWDLSRYEVMDGQQRINSVVDFYSDRFPLKGLKRWEELNGKTYSKLPELLKRGLDRRRITATVLLLEGSKSDDASKKDIRKLVFERLNTGGLQLNPQEIRNCLYGGRFNELLIELARTKLFTDTFEIPAYKSHLDKQGEPTAILKENKLYKRMLDCELVLRFFAFRKKSNLKGSVRAMLDRTMEENQEISEAVVDTLRTEFSERLAAAHSIFGKEVFRYLDENGKTQVSYPFYDAVMVAIDRLWESRSQLVQSRTAIKKRVQALLKVPESFDLIIGKFNTAKTIGGRMDLLEKALRG